MAWRRAQDNYREGELALDDLEDDDALAAAAVARARAAIRDAHGVGRFLAPHAIDLAEDGGEIRPHVDSVKFSGGVVAGLSLLNAATLRLARADPATGEPLPDAPVFERRLAPGSLYVLSGEARYDFAHAIRDIDGRRLSVMLRDAKEEA